MKVLLIDSVIVIVMLMCLVYIKDTAIKLMYFIHYRHNHSAARPDQNVALT